MTISEIEQLVMRVMDRCHDDVHGVKALAPAAFLNQAAEPAEAIRPAPLQHARPRRRSRAFSPAARPARRARQQRRYGGS
jgi:hypothetical protein